MNNDDRIVLAFCLIFVTALSIVIIMRKQRHIEHLHARLKCFEGYTLGLQESSSERLKIDLRTIQLQDSILDFYHSSRNAKHRNKELLNLYQELN